MRTRMDRVVDSTIGLATTVVLLGVFALLLARGAAVETIGGTLALARRFHSRI